MTAFLSNYFALFVNRFGQGWNRFWYTPRDGYSLGLMRLCLGVLLLYLHLTYTPDVVRFFGTDGVISPEVVVEMRQRIITGEQNQIRYTTINPRYLSYLYLFDDAFSLRAVHLIGAVILLLFTIGLKSRVMCVLAWLITLSYMHRAPFVTSAVEPIVCLLLFYMCFGRSGASFSVDSWLARRRAAREPGFARELEEKSLSFGNTIALRLMQVHVTVIYLAMGLAKLSGPPIVTEGSAWTNPWGAGHAVWLLIARPESPWVNLDWIAGYPYLFQSWTLAIVVFELAFGVFIWNRLARPLMLLVALPMWGSLALISGIAPFSVAMLIANLAFFDPEEWRELGQARGAAEDAAAESREPGRAATA
ncbi:MAG: hypothetical protein DWQ42_21660 [Planctomycetota bacterium]|nr:MAG: hypothetical protein DWQ42_21660 [Planctomycetota bacterium]REK40962.1 MAG: hypothetical protein DWQ46_14850 [Planctomycetota bacterium]